MSKRLSIHQAAKLLNRRHTFVLKLIEHAEIDATDERAPGANAPCYRIDPAEIEKWRASRTVRIKGREPQTENVVTVARTGVVRERLARMRNRQHAVPGRD